MTSDRRARRRTTVLAVDDKRGNLLALEAVLGNEHDLIFASSGPEAIALLESRNDIDLVLMDIQMPLMDGFEAAKRIKRLPHGKNVPIVFVTAEFADDPYVRRGYEVGGIDYFTKPLDPELLRLKVNIYASMRLKEELLAERERRIAESEELLHLERGFASVFVNACVGVVIVDATGSVTHQTDDARSLLAAWSVSDALPIPLRGQLDRALEHEESIRERVEVSAADGSPKTLLSCVSLLRGANGERLGAVLVLHDVTDMLKLHAEVEGRAVKLAS